MSPHVSASSSPTRIPSRRAQEREPVARRQEPIARPRARRPSAERARASSPRESDRDAIASRIRRDARMIEHHRQHAERLTDRLAREASSSSSGRRAAMRRGRARELERAERGEDAAERNRVGSVGAGGDVEPRGAPRLGCRRTVTTAGRSSVAASSPMSGTRRAASSPKIQSRRARASRSVPN